MNRSIFLRLVWKEYRLQRALWIAMILLTAMLLFLFHVFALNTTERFCWQLSAGLVLPALYCLGCGATLFAGEREAGTFEFQRSLPVGAKTVFAAKFLFALASAAAMFALSGAALLMLNPGSEINPSEMLQRYAVAVGRRMPLLGLELLLWSVLFSLLLRRVLVAAVLGVVVGSVNFEFARGWYSHFWGGDVWIAPELIFTTVAVALADLWLGARWFREKRQRGGRAVPSIAGNGLAAWSDRFLRPSRLTMVGRLAWQHWRQTWRLAAVLVGATTLPLMILIIQWLAASKFLRGPAFSSWQGEGQINNPVWFFFGVVPAFVGVSLLGLTAFHPDQWGRGYRFLADRGATPKYVWLSRQLVCWTSAAAALPALLIAALIQTYAAFHYSGRTLSLLWLLAQTSTSVIGYVILSVSAGQFCSMFFRSGILAGLFGIILTLALAGWTALMWIWRINCLWAVLPIPLALLLATRLRTRDWLVERNTLRAWLRPGLALAVPALALLAAVPLYRVYQIPWVDPGFSPDEFARDMTPEEFAAIDRYERKAGTNTSVYYNPAKILLNKAVENQLHGKLDEALENYLEAMRVVDRCRYWYAIITDNRWSGRTADDREIKIYPRLSSWAVCPGQTPERLLAARKQLEQLTAGFSSDKGIKLRHLRLQQLYEGEPEALDKATADMSKHQRQLTLLWLRLPSERARVLRILNMQTANLLGLSAQLDRKSATGERLWTHYTTGPRDFRRDAWRNAIYPLDKLAIENFYLYFEIIRQRAAIEAERRAVQIILAMEAWKLQHGSLPKTLDELVDTCLDRLPNDPYTGKPFLYFPEGVPTAFTYYQSFGGLGSDVEIPAGKPFIWSAGKGVRPREIPAGAAEEPIVERYLLMNDGRDGWRKPLTETELWSAGRPFPIP
ncbi:MAG: hypothetical protein GX594_12050 [Pirellulaceae bacterium]|nr:hypothetical protein [Pirellulaceae bacterium]